MNFNRKPYKGPFSVDEICKIWTDAGLDIHPQDIILTLHDEYMVKYERLPGVKQPYFYPSERYVESGFFVRSECTLGWYKCLRISEEGFWALCEMIPKVRRKFYYILKFRLDQAIARGYKMI